VIRANALFFIVIRGYWVIKFETDIGKLDKEGVSSNVFSFPEKYIWMGRVSGLR